MSGDNIRNIDKARFFEQKTLSDKIRFLLRYAILAPSTHNTQPWLFEAGPGFCNIYLDPTLELHEADPRGRDLHISIGCCLENLVIAARYFGIFKDVLYHFQNNLVAEVLFRETSESPLIDTSGEKLLDAIIKRINARGLFEKKPIPRELRDRLSQTAIDTDVRLYLIEQPEKIAALARLTAEGLKIAYAHPRFRREMARWLRSSFSGKPDGIPGYALRLPALFSVIFPNLVRFFNIGKKLSFLNYVSVASAPLACVICAKSDSPILWVKTGQLAERLMLECTAAGIKTSVFVASIEMGDLYKKVEEILETDWTPQFLFCAGFMDFNQKFTLRHPAEKKYYEKI